MISAATKSVSIKVHFQLSNNSSESLIEFAMEEKSDNEFHSQVSNLHNNPNSFNDDARRINSEDSSRNEQTHGDSHKNVVCEDSITMTAPQSQNNAAAAGMSIENLVHFARSVQAEKLIVRNFMFLSMIFVVLNILNVFMCPYFALLTIQVPRDS